MLNIVINDDNGKITVELEGKLDTATSPELDSKLKEILPGVKELTIDFAKLNYISSAGLKVFLAAQKYMEDNNLPTVIAINVNDRVAEIFELVDFFDVLDVR
ncbi:MAG: STAS domain-containing protein [Lachnospiraceae bacterium]|nr:STAS domain-containing protein [Lachnospiraceae bacterium]